MYTNYMYTNKFKIYCKFYVYHKNYKYFKNYMHINKFIFKRNFFVSYYQQIFGLCIPILYAYIIGVM